MIGSPGSVELLPAVDATTAAERGVLREATSDLPGRTAALARLERALAA